MSRESPCWRPCLWWLAGAASQPPGPRPSSRRGPKDGKPGGASARACPLFLGVFIVISCLLFDSPVKESTALGRLGKSASWGCSRVERTGRLKVFLSLFYNIQVLGLSRQSLILCSLMIKCYVSAGPKVSVKDGSQAFPMSGQSSPSS